MNNNDNNGEITVNPEEIARKIKSNAGDLKKTLKKYITKREIFPEKPGRSLKKKMFATGMYPELFEMSVNLDNNRPSFYGLHITNIP